VASLLICTKLHELLVILLNLPYAESSKLMGSQGLSCKVP